jgi:hypothetical protein
MTPNSPSTLLQALLTSLTLAQQGDPNHALPLDGATLTGTSGADLLNLFQQQLGITSFTLASDVQLPASVTGDTLLVSGRGQGLTLTVTFQDLGGQVGMQALFQAPALSTLTTFFGSALPQGFYQDINISGAQPSVTVPGVGPALVFASAVYGLIGFVTPSSGLITYSIAPQIQGQVSPPGGSKGLAVELGTAASGWRLAPPDGSAWSFDDLGWLLPGLGVLAAFPDIIPTKDLGLGGFVLNLFPQAPKLSALTLEVAELNDPTKPLWSAAGGKVELTDVIVTLALDYDAQLTLSLAGGGWVEGDFMLGSLALSAQIPFPFNQGVWSITSYPNLQLPDLGAIATLLSGGQSMQSLLPAGLADLGGFTFTYLRVAVNGGDFSLSEFTFALGSTNLWKLIPDNVLTLDSLRISVTIDSTMSVIGSVSGHFKIGSAGDVYISFGRTSATLPWGIRVISPAIALPDIADMTQLAQGADLSGQIQAAGLNRLHFLITNLNLGLTVSPTKLTNLGMTVMLASGSSPLDPSLDWEVIPDTLTLTNFSVGFQLDWNPDLNIGVFGLFTVNGLSFEVRFGQGANADAFIAAYSPTTASTGTIDVKQFISQISKSVAGLVPDGVEIEIKDAVVAYINTGGVKKYLFAMDVSLEIPLSEIPLVGKEFSSSAEVGIKNLKVVVASAAMSVSDVALINQLITELHGSVSTLPSPGSGQAGNAIPSGFSVIAELQLGDHTILLTSPAANPQSARTQTAALTPAAAAAPDNSVMWVNVQKSFGPVSLQKVGFKYQGGALFVLANMSLVTAGLEIDLLGLGIGSPITHPSVEFTIQGIAVSFQEPPVVIMGGMIGTFSPVNFVGAISVQVPEFALEAFAGYTEDQNHHPSFFLYGVLDAPLGGPPAFFITGVAAGFGFNRQLIIPDVSQVANFPLVQWAVGSNNPPGMDPNQPIGGQVEGVLTRLAGLGIVPPSVGDYWLAAGLSFTSFELVSSFALLTVEFGNRVEIALLGLSTLQIPPDEPVAEVQIALEVAFSFDTGLLAIAGQLTNNSYILSKSCHLTGGFAFYYWFGQDHQGEMVLTFGGYNPNFTVPDYYPTVPRLGMNWQVDSALTITGALYFALTTNVVMAGGSMSIVWQSGSISAWCNVWADFLMVFTPFHYYIDAGIDLGASFRVHLLFVTISMTIHLGVDIVIWGPEFTGKATVDLSIISFTISFGASDQNTSTKVLWSEFVRQLMPPQSDTSTKTGARNRLRGRVAGGLAADDSDTQPAVVQINVSQGLIRTLDATADDPQYLVNSQTFQCVVITQIPVKQTTFSGAVSLASQQPTDSQGNPIEPNTNFGVGPAAILPADFQPELTLTLTVEPKTESQLAAVYRLGNSPKALWENKTFDGNGVPQVDPGKALTDATVTNTLQGYTLIPVVTPPDHTLPIPVEALLFDLDVAHIQPFAWSTPTVPTTDPFTTETVASTINTAGVTGVRNQLLVALQQQGITLNPQINVASLANPANNDLMAPPRLRLLGEQKAGT